MIPYSDEIAGLATGLLWATMGKELTAVGINLYKVFAGLVILTIGMLVAGQPAWPGELQGRQIAYLLGG